MNHIYPAENALILVAVMKTPRDLEIARLLGWYRIPLRSAPKVVAVDYLAFYQTAAFGDQKWRIRYIAGVRGHELTTRGQLLQDETEHPQANQEYYKVQIGPLVELPKPVLADKWRRVTFFYTTGEYLQKAQTLGELVVPSEGRRILWQALRERTGTDHQYQAENIDLDPAILAALLGIKEADAIYLDAPVSNEGSPA